MGLPNLPKCTGMRAARQELDASYGASGLTCRIFFLLPLSLSLSPSLFTEEERARGVHAKKKKKSSHIFAAAFLATAEAER